MLIQVVYDRDGRSFVLPLVLGLAVVGVVLFSAGVALVVTATRVVVPSSLRTAHSDERSTWEETR